MRVVRLRAAVEISGGSDARKGPGGATSGLSAGPTRSAVSQPARYVLSEHPVLQALGLNGAVR